MDELRSFSHNMGGRISAEAKINQDSTISHPVYICPRVELHKNTKIGKYTFINHDTVLYKNTTIGRYCSIGRNSEIGLSSHPVEFLSTHLFQTKDNNFFSRSAGYEKIEKRDWTEHNGVEIRNDVWIGSKVSVLDGVTVGDGAIIGAGAVVTKDVEPYSIVVGVPARIIKKRFSDKIIEELKYLKWWELDFKDLEKVDFSDIYKAIDAIKTIKNL